MKKSTTFTLNKDQSLVLFIDVQERLLPVMHNKESLMKQLKILLEATRVLHLPLIATEQYPKGVGHTCQELQPFIQDFPLLEKTTFTAWSPALSELLENHHAKQIIIAGIETHICVFQTVRDLLSHRYEVFVLQDGVSSRTPENKNNGLDLMREMGAVITNTESVLFDLLHASGTPEFKAISSLIK